MARTAQPARTTNNNATTTTTTAAAAIDHQDDDATKNTAGASQNDPIVATIDLSNELADRDLPASLSAHIQQSQWAEFIEDAVRHVHRTGIRDRIGQTSVCMTHCLLCFILLSFFLVPFFINLTRPEPPFGGVIPSFYVFLIFPLVVVECAICCGAMYRYAKNKERRQDALDDRINEELCKPMNLAHPAFHFEAKNDFEVVDLNDGNSSGRDETLKYTHYIVVTIKRKIPGGGGQHDQADNLNSLLDDFMANRPSSSAAIPLEITTAGNADDDIEV